MSLQMGYISWPKYPIQQRKTQSRLKTKLHREFRAYAATPVRPSFQFFSFFYFIHYLYFWLLFMERCSQCFQIKREKQLLILNLQELRHFSFFFVVIIIVSVQIQDICCFKSTIQEKCSFSYVLIKEAEKKTKMTISSLRPREAKTIFSFCILITRFKY